MGSSNQMPVGCAYEANVSCQWAISSVYCLLFAVKLPNNWNSWSAGSLGMPRSLPAPFHACLSVERALRPFCLTFSWFYAWQFHFPTTKLPEIEQFRPVIEHRPTTCCQAWTCFDMCVCEGGGEKREREGGYCALESFRISHFGFIEVPLSACSNIHKIKPTPPSPRCTFVSLVNFQFSLCSSI